MTVLTKTPARRALAVAYAIYLAAVAFLVFTPGGGAPGGPLLLVLEGLNALGLDATRAQVEVGLNVVLFVPLSLLGAFLFRRSSVVFWVAAGALLSLVIELVQLAIPGRVSTLQDVVANTSGATLGALLALGLALWGSQKG